MSPAEIVTAVLLAAGSFVAVTSGLGVLRMPDFFTRIHPAGKNDTLAQTLVLAGLMVAAGASLTSLKLFLIWAFLIVTTPTATHAIARAAWIDGRRPWRADGDRVAEAAPGAEGEAP